MPRVIRHDRRPNPSKKPITPRHGVKISPAFSIYAPSAKLVLLAKIPGIVAAGKVCLYNLGSPGMKL